MLILKSPLYVVFFTTASVYLFIRWSPILKRALLEKRTFTLYIFEAKADHGRKNNYITFPTHLCPFQVKGHISERSYLHASESTLAGPAVLSGEQLLQPLAHARLPLLGLAPERGREHACRETEERVVMQG